MSVAYNVHIDRNLDLLEKSVEFLEGEFGNFDGPPKWTTALLRWKLSDVNPNGKGILAVAEIDGEVIATASLVFKPIILDGVELVGAEIGDTYSAEKLRRLAKPKILIATNRDPNHYVNKSIFGRLVSEITNLAKDMGCQVIYGTPNQNSLPGYCKKLNFLETLAYRNVSRSMPTSLYIKNIIRLPEPFLTLSTFLGSRMADFYRSIILKIFKPAKLFVENLFPIDEDIDELWKKCRPSKGFSLIKDSKYYKYRFKDHPLQEYNYNSFYIDGKLSCFLVSCVKTDFNGNKIVFICDYLTDEKISFIYLLNYFVEIHAHLPIVKYNLWCEKYSYKFWHAFFSGFLGGSEVPIIFFNSDEISEQRLKILNLDFHLGSSDNI